MSEQAKIVIVGQPRAKLLAELAAIKKWDNGHNYPILVSVGNKSIEDTIVNVEAAIKNDLSKYIIKNFCGLNEIIKTGGDNDVYIVPDNIVEYGHRSSLHSRHSNYTAPKKKRRGK
jgi:hypothetical protein